MSPTNLMEFKKEVANYVDGRNDAIDQGMRIAAYTAHLNTIGHQHWMRQLESAGLCTGGTDYE